MSSEIQSTETVSETTNEPVNDRYKDFIVKGTEVVKEEAKAEPAPKEPEVVEEDTETDEGEETVEKERKRKRGGGYQKKLARQAAYIAELEAKLAPKGEASQDAISEPNPENYTDWQEYQKDLRKYDREVAKAEALAEFEAKQREKEGKTQLETKVKTFNEKQDEARKIYADYDDVLADFADVPVNPAIHEAMLESDLGAEMAYYLATNEAIFEKLNDPKLSPVILGKELGKIEALLEGKKSGQTAVKVTKAPPPISPLKPKAKTSNSLEDLTGDYEAYRKARGYI